MTDSLVLVTQSNFIAPAADLQTAMHRYQAVKDFIGNILKEGVDFGKIPGADKPALLKPGAEKMCSFFGLTPKFPLEDREEDWTGERHGGEPFFYYRYKCQLYRGDQLIAEGEGSCNSWEKKYRYRTSERVCPKCGKPAIIAGKKEYGGGWICFTKKGGCNAKFAENAPEITNQQMGQIKNPDPADIVNTLQKMAQKRALVAPVLIATNTSDYFTQDIEDFIDAPFVDVKVIPPEPPSNPTPVQDYQDKLREVEANKPVINPSNGDMTLEEAMQVTNSEGVKYGDMDDDQLRYMTIGINKGLKKSDLTNDKQSEYLHKMDAIKIIQDSRKPITE